MKGIWAAIARELRLIFRDSIAIYLVISPAALALVFILVFGSVEKANLSFVIDGSLTPETVVRLEAVADLETVRDLESLKARVNGADSIAGVTAEGGTVRLIVEGNEPEGFADQRRSLVAAALGAGGISYETEAVEAQTSRAYAISMACVFLLALFIGGATLGLGGVGERESGTIRAVAVSPMSLAGYVVSKIVPALLLGLAGVSAAAPIMGRGDALPRLLLLALASAFVCGMMIFLMIAFADNQIAAVGVLKIIMPLFLVVGISAAFVPERWLFPYYALPMYWQYVAIDAAISGDAAIFPLLMLLAAGFVWFLAVMLVFTRRVKIKAWR